MLRALAPATATFWNFNSFQIPRAERLDLFVASCSPLASSLVSVTHHLRATMALHPSLLQLYPVSLEPIGPTPIHVRPSLSYAGIPINLTKHEVNALAPLTASIWPNQGESCVATS